MSVNVDYGFIEKRVETIDILHHAIEGWVGKSMSFCRKKKADKLPFDEANKKIVYMKSQTRGILFLKKHVDPSTCEALQNSQFNVWNLFIFSLFCRSRYFSFTERDMQLVDKLMDSLSVKLTRYQSNNIRCHPSNRSNSGNKQ